MELSLPISLIVAHFLGDFVFQSNWMALNKSKDWNALTTHTTVYAGVMGLWSLGHLPNHLGGFLVLTFLTHFLTDAITSRITSKLWFIDLKFLSADVHWYKATVDMRKRYWFFVMIGLDQLIHYVTLALTIKLLS